MFRAFRVFAPFGLVLLWLLTAGCEEAVNPILESDRNFTLFGTLDMARDTQFVRVIPIRPILDPGEAEPLDITFTSEDLNTGRRLVWRDSLVFFEDGSFGHIFYAPLRLQAGHTYRLDITAPDVEAVTRVETTAPEAPRARVLPEQVGSGPGGGFSSGSQRIVWEGLSRAPFRVDLWYRFLVNEQTLFRDIRLPYEPANQPSQEEDWEVLLDLRKDRITLDTLTNVEAVPLLGLGLELLVLDEAFVPPGGVFDPEILVQPGTFSNVENGFGFVGTVGRFSVEWVLEETSMERLNYLTLEQKYGAGRAAALRARLLAREE